MNGGSAGPGNHHGIVSIAGIGFPRAADTQREEVARLLRQVVQCDSLVVNSEVSIGGP